MKSSTGQQNTGKTSGQKKRPCRLVRKRLFGQASVRDRGLYTGFIKQAGINLEATWVQNHIAACARCQQRFFALNRVNLALTLMKSHPHRRDLLNQANTQTVNVLQRKLRKTGKAHSLRSTLPNLTVPDRIRLLHQACAHVAACITILLLSKIGVFSTIKHSQVAGQRAVKQLYSSHLDADQTDDVFPT